MNRDIFSVLKMNNILLKSVRNKITYVPQELLSLNNIRQLLSLGPEALGTKILSSFFSDTCFIRSVIKHAELQSNYTDVYFYQFSYLGPLGGSGVNESDIASDSMKVIVLVEGFSDTVRHGEELGYLFSRNYGGYNSTDLSKYSESDITILKRMLTMFTNFAKVLNPTPEESELLENIIWPTVNAANFSYLDIGSYSEIKLNPRESTYSRWNEIYEKYAVKPYDTY